MERRDAGRPGAGCEADDTRGAPGADAPETAYSVLSLEGDLERTLLSSLIRAARRGHSAGVNGGGDSGEESGHARGLLSGLIGARFLGSCRV